MTVVRQVGVVLAGAGALLLAGELAGCSQCGGVVCDACPAPFTALVTDAVTGQPVADVVVVGADGSCEVRADLGYTQCDVWLPIGDSELTLSASGYSDAPVSVTINPDSGESCCSCDYNPKRREVSLAPL
ncbi:MAG: hypothetical protein JRI23_34260 [Deltaproteobacteria bacterium]|jgi:hypothetical protein|nr:hypothetical protein [Deltaproteobacteria bacterium]MBW2537362.1 hypothetical protein [Deltaproteobacteria bacterium]